VRSKFTRLEVSGDDFVLEWLSETNATYEVAHATDLVVADWVSLATQYAATAGTNVTSFVHSGGATNQTGFYKVAQTGIRILLCDSNTYSGVLDIPIEVGMPNNQELTGIYFLIDGEPTMALVSPQHPFSGTPTATLDTASISNGWHTVQAFAEYPTGQNEAGGVRGTCKPDSQRRDVQPNHLHGNAVNIRHIHAGARFVDCFKCGLDRRYFLSLNESGPGIQWYDDQRGDRFRLGRERHERRRLCRRTHPS
jgi:hypothetical protein